MSLRGLAAALSIVALGGIAGAEPVSCLPARCVRREALDPVTYQSLGRFLILGGCYAEWGKKDCYPERLDDDALAAAPRGSGYVVSFTPGREVFLVDPGTAWLTQCPKIGLVATNDIPVTGAKALALKQHLASMPAFASLDLREIGFAEARSREGRGLFALYLGTDRRNVFLQCFEDLDAAVAQAAENLAR